MYMIAKRKKSITQKSKENVRENTYQLEPILSETHIEEEHTDFERDVHQHVLPSIFTIHNARSKIL